MKKQEKSQHEVIIHAYLMDRNYPVIIMYFVEGILINHIANPKSADKNERHSQPSNLLVEFIDMAIHLLKGLNWLHSSIGAKPFIHKDIKLSNIGFSKIKGQVIWKLLDFGLAKSVPIDKFTTQHIKEIICVLIE